MDTPTEPTIDVGNHQFVSTNLGANGRGTIVVQLPRPMTADQALVHAAWLVTLAEPFASFDFTAARSAVEAT